jgi:ATP-dependent RNA helicase DDX52/ROK1
LILVFPLQRAAVLRKRFDIHIAGQNAPAPLESFEELISRLGFSTIIGQLQIMVIMEPFQVVKLTSFLQ